MRKKITGIAICTAAFLFGFYVIPTLNEAEEPHHNTGAPRLSFTYTPPSFAGTIQSKANRDKVEIIVGGALAFFETIDSAELPAKYTKLTSLGSYYITGYTSVECGGSTTTASGTTCHKASSIADSINNPTTCAIDPALHDFGDVFFIEGFGYFIAEDTGSAVKGKHLDLYFWADEYNYALSITGNYQVYAVEYIDTTFQAGAYDIRDKVAEQVTGWSIKTTEEEENNGIL